MNSKTWPTIRSDRCLASSRQLKCHTDPIIYVAEDCRKHGNKMTSKRNPEENLERASKRSRTSQSPSKDCSQTFSGPSTSYAPSTPSVYSSPPDTTETLSLPAPSIGDGEGTQETQKSGKRKSTFDESSDGPTKRSRGTPSPSASAGVDASTSTPAEAEGRKSGKRKSEEREEPRKRSRKTTKSSEGTSPQSSNSSDEPGTSSSVNTAPPHSRVAFESKYTEEQLLGAGGYGSVYAGHRKDDNLPVAVKHISQFDVPRTSMILDGKHCVVPLEVALLLKVKPAAGETSAVVPLLDWYDLDYDLILVLERPVPCLDLSEYINSKESCMQEREAKTIAKQLVDALIEVHSKGVFHRDIKTDNILIETSSDVPCVRLIDFGCGTFLSDGLYIADQGTYEYSPPETFESGWYRAEPSTVWQLGVVLFGMLHRFLPFSNSTEIVHKNPEIRDDLSFDCQGFLLSCLVKSPEARPTLEALKHHPWLE